MSSHVFASSRLRVSVVDHDREGIIELVRASLRQQRSCRFRSARSQMSIGQFDPSRCPGV